MSQVGDPWVSTFLRRGQEHPRSLWSHPLSIHLSLTEVYVSHRLPSLLARCPSSAPRFHTSTLLRVITGLNTCRITGLSDLTHTHTPPTHLNPPLPFCLVLCTDFRNGFCVVHRHDYTSVTLRIGDTHPHTNRTRGLLPSDKSHLWTFETLDREGEDPHVDRL